MGRRCGYGTPRGGARRLPAIPSSLEHDTGAHPERAARIPAIERALAERDWLGFERVQAPAAERALIEAVHPPEHVDAIEALCARGGGMIDVDTVASAGSYEAALHAAGGAAHWSTCCSAARGVPAASAACARPATTPSPPGRWASACSTTSRSPRAGRSTRTAPSACWSSTGTSTTATGPTTSSTPTPGCCSSRSTSRRCTRAPGRRTTSAPARARATRSTCRCRRGSGDDVFLSLVEHVVVPLARAYAPGLVLVSAGYDAHRDDPLADCEVTEDGYAAMAGPCGASAPRLGAPLGVVLEGGYDLGALHSVRRPLRCSARRKAPRPDRCSPSTRSRPRRSSGCLSRSRTAALLLLTSVVALASLSASFWASGLASGNIHATQKPVEELVLRRCRGCPAELCRPSRRSSWPPSRRRCGRW